MIGDFVILLRKWWSQLRCHHDYKWIGYKWHDAPSIYECKKCGRIR